MSYIIAGLGNPGDEYDETRHNAGRMSADFFARKNKFGEFEPNKKIQAHVSKGKLSSKGGSASGGKKETVMVVLPNTYMNKSGLALKPLIGNAKAAERLIVIHDDLGLPIGRIKISFNKSSGGHRGVENIIRNIKTEAFVRIRIGISKANAKGIVKKPSGEDAVNDFIIGKFKPPEFLLFKKELKKVSEAIEMIILEGRERAMGE